MAHEFESGFSVREPMWHGLGTILEDYPGRKEAMEAAGHNWKILEVPIQLKRDKKPSPIDFATYQIPVEEWKALVRSDTGEVMTVARGPYQVVQNEVLWDVVDAILEQKNVKYETAGVLRSGLVLWVLARLDEPAKIKGDDSETLPYVLVSTGHDATRSFTASAVETRVVCMNTLQMADLEARRSGRAYTFRHFGKDTNSRIEDAKAAMGLIHKQHEAFIHLANELAGIEITDAKVKDFLLEFIPEPRVADGITDRQRANIDKARQQVQELLDLGRTIPNKHRRTAYGLMSAGIEWLDYVRVSHNAESRFRRAMFDETAAKGHLVKLVQEIVA